jgi:hypothetical protein
MWSWLMGKKDSDSAKPKPKAKPPAVPPLWATSLADRLNELIERLDRIEGELVKENNIGNVNGMDVDDLRKEMNLRLDNLFNAMKQSREWRGHIVLEEYTPK